MPSSINHIDVLGNSITNAALSAGRVIPSGAFLLRHRKIEVKYFRLNYRFLLRSGFFTDNLSPIAERRSAPPISPELQIMGMTRMFKHTLTHDEAFRKAKRLAETARPAITDHEFWNNDYTDDMISIIRDPSFMAKGTFFASALTEEDRAYCERFLLRGREIDLEDKAVRERLRLESQAA